ncbi:heparinase II/III family protein [Paenibacillus qinlingensis]|nr:heparinase II/III family protein [Paenibacillus qinlingensis]
MTSDPERISLYFRSSPYGSYSNSLADQNSFILHAYGESLAIKSGFYDYYNSAHHKGFTKRTISANAITLDGGQGQPVNDFDAKGRIVGFASHPAFDATTGDAVGAYEGELTRAFRHIVYVRPSVFVVIDDLATSKPAGVSFEWNLHANQRLTLDSNGGATIEKGKAGLKVRFLGRKACSYQASVKTHFRDPNGEEVPPVAGFSGMTQVHATFATSKTNAAILVATLAPYRLDNSPEEIMSEEYEDFIRLAFADGTMLYVRTAPEGLVDTGGFGFRFEGAALAVRDGSLLLVHGTKAERDGIIVAQSNMLSTIAWGDGRLSVSVEGEANLSLLMSSPIHLRDESTGHDLPEGGNIENRLNSQGVHWTASSDRLQLQLEKGYRAFTLDESPMPGSLQTVILPTEIDGVIGQTVLEAWRDIDGLRVSWGNLEIEPGHYEVLQAPEGLTFTRHGRIRDGVLSLREPIILRGESAMLRLRRI